MFQMFSGGAAAEQSWPLSKVVAALEAQFGSLESLGEDGPLKVFGVEDNGVNFVVAVMQTGPDTGKISELGFLARFVGFPVDIRLVEALNRNLHISMASLEGSDLFLMAGLAITGAFDAGQFKLIIQQWRRDLMMTLHGLSDESSSLAAAFPAARMESARNFAMNVAPAPTDNRPVDMLSSFLGGNAKKAICADCGGRGKRGLIARMCGECDGSGFVTRR
ncbi:hypothetical protein PUV54_13210 [Hyphococcus flavus]|uniref:Uncharacterized protein n=1 Tax=Hyphococcus flavus TaxID=1866326 RepID=A0AAF0CGP5_9PROT|nr:hypothetical protein [Hyphococcus flavus]WDI30912.1 hypothetical protein PUV54_13210 [Hyphococcus flavus]